VAGRVKERRSNAPPLPDYWAADTLEEAGAEVHLAHPLGVKGFSYRRVKNDERDSADVAQPGCLTGLARA
jgi:hypothetical protein